MNRAIQKVRAYRKRFRPRMTQADLAVELGLSPSHWHRIERGEVVPSLKVAVLLQSQGICECEDWFSPGLHEQQRAA